MSKIGEIERRTQNRVVSFLKDLPAYTYLGTWQDAPRSTNIETDILTDWLRSRGYDVEVVRKAVRQLIRTAALGGARKLMDVNRGVYDLLRYGVKVIPHAGAQTITVPLVDWANPDANRFGFAQEVTVSGKAIKRPDIVIYLNGIAVVVLELKRASVSVTEGIRQSLSNQTPDFIEPFFTTVQLVLAGNETEGVRYGVIGTPEKYWLRWTEERPEGEPATFPDSLLLDELYSLLRPERLLEMIHDFTVFDGGVRKTCRHNQYFGVQAAREFARRREGGVIWHTQGSGKSLTMVWLARWIRENIDGGRVLIITDRSELDEQIEKIFIGVDEKIHRATSGADLISVLGSSEEWLVGSLIHKFGRADGGNADEAGGIDDYLSELTRLLPADFAPRGELFVFVDECHRTQSGKLHDAMKAIMPKATIIGFTGTPLLKSDKRRTIETFGPYIHTYKYDQAVRDGVVLDLRYEARDIDQRITNQASVDQWFEAKTAGLTDIARAQIKQRWGTMQSVLSSRERLEKIVADILLDMATRDRLRNDRGNALLVSDSIYSACRFYEMFQQTELAGKCAIVTSYKPSPHDIAGETTGEGVTERLNQYRIYRRMLADHFGESEDTAMYKADTFEKEVKRRFVHEPAVMKLLIVVDKLLTGFDAPSATYLYIDKQMQDHGLFQAICRVNRLDGEDKEYGYVVDYKDLFRSLERSIKDYTSGAFDAYDAEDVSGLLKDRLTEGRRKLEDSREALRALCEPVEPPRDAAAYRRYFVSANPGDHEAIADNQSRRLTLYRLVSTLVRAFADLANEMGAAGYTPEETETIRAEIVWYEQLRKEIKVASGDYVDMKLYEPAMRHLLDAYIRADDSRVLSDLDDLTLIQLVIDRGEAGLEDLAEDMTNDGGDGHEAMAETIENNVRRLIIDEMEVNPKYYEQMSHLLDALITQRRRKAISYKEYLQQIVELTRKAA
jgi:type I restriction enzyme R subunit